MVTPGEYQAELDLPITYDVNTEIEAIEVASDPTLQLDADDIASPLLDAESVSDAPQAPVEVPPEVLEPEPDVPSPPLPASPPAPPSSPNTNQPDVQQQLSWYQQQHQQQQQQKYQEEVNKAEESYRERLLDDGFMPDQAKKLASEARQQAEYQQSMQAQHQQQLQFEQGRYNAARHYARHYSLGINELEALEKLPDPASMERESRRIAEIRDLRNKYEQVAKGRVTPAEYDSGASSAGASRSRERILDDYAEGRVNLTADQYHRLMSNN
jgi:hypothetical protein|tara:strand:+ start:883 stop:1692 length:810 start_codon:yes stop_codon:yes gene_type:complete